MTLDSPAAVTEGAEISDADGLVEVENEPGDQVLEGRPDGERNREPADTETGEDAEDGHSEFLRAEGQDDNRADEPDDSGEQAEHVGVQRRLGELFPADERLQPSCSQDPESPGKPQEDEQRSGGVDRLREQARQIDLKDEGLEPEQHRDAGEGAQHVPPELVEPALPCAGHNQPMP
jgi:hypothetical protein